MNDLDKIHIELYTPTGMFQGYFKGFSKGQTLSTWNKSEARHFASWQTASKTKDKIEEMTSGGLVCEIS